MRNYFNLFRTGYFFAVMAEEGYLPVFLDCREPGLDRLVVGYAFRVVAAGYPDDLLRSPDHLLFSDLVVPDNVYGSVGGNQRETVDLGILQPPVGYLYDAFASQGLAAEVDADGDLVLGPLEVKQLYDAVNPVRRYVVQYCAVLYGIYYEVCLFHG